MSGGAGERSEKASQQRMRKVRKDGSLGRSQDLPGWLAVGAGALALPAVIARGSRAAQDQLLAVRDAAAAPGDATALHALEVGVRSVVPTLLPIFVAVVAAAVIGNVVQGGVHVSIARLKPKVTAFNPVNGLKRMFGPQAWWQGIKSLLKTLVVSGVVYLAVRSLVPVVGMSGRLSLIRIVEEVGAYIQRVVTWAVVAAIGLALADVLVVLRRNRKQTRMTKQEVKEDTRSAEGDPHVKGAIRARQLAAARNRMMAAVATADVVLVNPTHIAVALRYEPHKGAPRVVAKGQGHVALRIKERATTHHVAIVHDVPLARTLHAACEIGHEVPEHLYEAVARVLAFVMLLRRRGSAAGVHRLPVRYEERTAS
jgi:flagellar biosynthesis protein FlhB